MKLFCAGFTDVDAAVEVGELHFRAATVDGAAHGFVDLHFVLAAMTAAVFDDGLRCLRRHVHIEIAEDVAVVGAEADVGFEVGGEGDVDVAVERAESHGLLIDAREGDEEFPVERVRDGAAGDFVERDGAVYVVNVEFAIDARNYDVAVVDCAEMQRGVDGDLNYEIDRALDGVGADVDLVVFLFDVQAGGGDVEALRTGTIVVVVGIFAAARVCFDDDVFAFVCFGGDAAGDERRFDGGRTCGIAERDDDAVAAALLALLFFGGRRVGRVRVAGRGGVSRRRTERKRQECGACSAAFHKL